jgi:hypothetical protein
MKLSKAFPYTCSKCKRKTNIQYLMQLADRKNSKELKCVCGNVIGSVYN